MKGKKLLVGIVIGVLGGILLLVYPSKASDADAYIGCEAEVAAEINIIMSGIGGAYFLANSSSISKEDSKKFYSILKEITEEVWLASRVGDDKRCIVSEYILPRIKKTLSNSMELLWCAEQLAVSRLKLSMLEM